MNPTEVSQVRGSLGPTQLLSRDPLEQSHTHTVVLEAHNQGQPQVPSQGEDKQHLQMPLWLGVKATVRCGNCEAPRVTCSPSYTEPRKDSLCLFHLQLAPAVSPSVSRRSKRVTNCATGL